MQNITIFTDGASRGNPGPGGWGAIIIFPSGKIMTMNEELRIKNNEREVLQVKEIGGKEKNTTNNRMELTAVIESLVFVSKLKARPTGSSGRAKSLPDSAVVAGSKLTVRIYTDSSYVLKGASIWVKDWQKNNWKTKTKKPVLNQDLWKKFIKTSSNFKTEWYLLKGHSGIPANERCDEIATNFADGIRPKLYSSILKNYRIDLSVPAERERPKNQKSKTRKKEKAYSYVSLVGGIIKTHKTWAECEKRVKGKSGAKFKKSYSPGDEESIKSLWRQGSLL